MSCHFVTHRELIVYNTNVIQNEASVLGYIFQSQCPFASWGDFCLYSLDKLHLLGIMPSCYSQLEFAVVSGRHTISKHRSLAHMTSYIGTFFMWNQISACFIFTSPEKLYPFLCAMYLDLVSCLMEPTGTGQVNVTCPVGSTLSLSAEFKHRNISANAVHIWGDWQHLQGHWVKGERQSCFNGA
jgi:hypothetical protein